MTCRTRMHWAPLTCLVSCEERSSAGCRGMQLSGHLDPSSSPLGWVSMCHMLVLTAATTVHMAQTLLRPFLCLL